jgi:hypothetical protein
MRPPQSLFSKNDVLPLSLCQTSLLHSCAESTPLLAVRYHHATNVLTMHDVSSSIANAACLHLLCTNRTVTHAFLDSQWRRHQLLRSLVHKTVREMLPPHYQVVELFVDSPVPAEVHSVRHSAQ